VCLFLGSAWMCLLTDLQPDLFAKQVQLLSGNDPIFPRLHGIWMAAALVYILCTST
jgi:hypothetical protein